MPTAIAASAVPRRARRLISWIFMLASSHRNNGDFISARDADYWTRRDRDSAFAGQRAAKPLAEGGHGTCHLLASVGPGRDAAALKARHIAAGRERGVGVDRPIRKSEQHLALLRGAGIRGDLDVAGCNGALEFRAVAGDRAKRQRQVPEGLGQSDL